MDGSKNCGHDMSRKYYVTVLRMYKLVPTDTRDGRGRRPGPVMSKENEDIRNNTNSAHKYRIPKLMRRTASIAE